MNLPRLDMFFTKWRNPKTAIAIETFEYNYTHTLEVFSDEIVSRYKMCVAIIKRKDGLFQEVWYFNNYPLTPNGIRLNLKNRFEVSKEIKKINKAAEKDNEINV
jgi:hypothetical protein